MWLDMYARYYILWFTIITLHHSSKYIHQESFFCLMVYIYQPCVKKRRRKVVNRVVYYTHCLTHTHNSVVHIVVHKKHLIESLSRPKPANSTFYGNISQKKQSTNSAHITNLSTLQLTSADISVLSQGLKLDGLCMFCLMFDMFYSSLSKCMRTPLLESSDGSLSVRVDYIVMCQNYILHLALLCCMLVVCICHSCVKSLFPPYFTGIAVCRTGEFFMLHLLCTIQAVSINTIRNLYATCIYIYTLRVTMVNPISGIGTLTHPSIF